MNPEYPVSQVKQDGKEEINGACGAVEKLGN
jgi:hypothetical protein